MRVVCVGGGPAGLYFAILLKAQDAAHDVTVLERNPAGTTYGWGVVFWDDLLEQLRRSHPPTARAIADASFRWTGQVLEVDGKPPIRTPGRGYALGRHRLLDILAARAVRLGVRVEFEANVDELAHVPDADLVVACDGAHSRLRGELRNQLGTELTIGRNKYIWLGTSKVFRDFTFGFVETPAGWVWCHAYGFDADTSTFIAECSPETWASLGFDRLGVPEITALLESLFERQLGGHPLSTRSRGNATARWLSFTTVTNEKWHDGNVVLMGDAAHTTHFSIGSGTKLALEDAIALAGRIAENRELEATLERYERDRKPALALQQTDARLSAQWFENVPRYVDLDPQQLLALLLDRRSPLLPRIPPRSYYRLYRAARSPLLRRVRRWAAPRVKLLYNSLTR
jgi:2-polyprenyl-6-methoxyphenol hydroxylase-like FAD-dependent oxidoreductase